jgi:hypothetical protein
VGPAGGGGGGGACRGRASSDLSGSLVRRCARTRSISLSISLRVSVSIDFSRIGVVIGNLRSGAAW